MARRRAAKAAALKTEGTLIRASAVRIIRPVWLHNYKAQPGAIVTLESELADRLVQNGQAEVLTDE
jgi:hypothetical protein